MLPRAQNTAKLKLESALLYFSKHTHICSQQSSLCKSSLYIVHLPSSLAVELIVKKEGVFDNPIVTMHSNWHFKSRFERNPQSISNITLKFVCSFGFGHLSIRAFNLRLDGRTTKRRRSAVGKDIGDFKPIFNVKP